MPGLIPPAPLPSLPRGARVLAPIPKGEAHERGQAFPGPARGGDRAAARVGRRAERRAAARALAAAGVDRSEEHTSELQSLRHLVCRLLLEKKKNTAPQRTGWRGSTTPLSLARTTPATECPTRRSAAHALTTLCARRTA